MVTLRDGAVLEPVEANARSNQTEPTTKSIDTTSHATNDTTNKKRKSDVIDLTSEEPTAKKQELSTTKDDREINKSPNEGVREDAAKSHEREHIDRERTPGREGPIKEENHNLKPDIKPFKGEKGHKVRKTAWEKDQEYKQFAFENEGHTFHELHVCHRKGPNGSPTYDKSGFQLDWKKVDEWMAPKAYNKGAMMRGMDRAMDRKRKEAEEMANIFFVKGEAPEDPFLGNGKDVWKERVSQDLNVAWHKVGVEEFKQWEKMEFKKARKGEYKEFDEAGRKRCMRLLSGASLRK